MQDLCHATRYIRTSSNPTGGILLKFLYISIFSCAFLFIFLCVLFFVFFCFDFLHCFFFF